ncbi:Calmodulin [Diplonema papillatum]|nr:Calmodulin [Diplonema papillatum]|eukprot:gene16261-24921_t
MFARAFRSAAARSTLAGSRRTLTADHLRFSFEKADVDKSGFLEQAELEAALKNQGCNMSEEQFARLVSAMDTDGDGRISLEEFERFVYPIDFEGCTFAEDTKGITEREMRELASL